MAPVIAKGVAGAVRQGGIYALVALDGAPLDRADLAALGLDTLGLDILGREANGSSGEGSCIATAALDAITPAAARTLVTDGRTTVFLGWLDEPDEVADRLGLSRATPQAVLARAALDRWGSATPDQLLGGWAMLDHRADGPGGGGVSLLVGIGGRAPLLYARAGGRLAVAPSIHALSRLGWIGRTLDEESFLQALTITMPAGERRSRTILSGVRRVPRGGCIVFGAGSAAGAEPRVRVADPFVPVPRWCGGKGEAIEAAEALLRRIVGQMLARSPAPGLLLSGGLDSSLIAWALTAEGSTTERGTAGGGAALPALSSAVAPGRGVADETRWAAAVANRLGLPLHRVVPPADVNVYRPSAAVLAVNNAPVLSPRDYLYAAFADAAAALGVTELFDGAHGELSFTASVPVRSWRSWPRDVARTVRNGVRDRWRAIPDPADAILDVALARHRFDRSETTLRDLAASRPAGQEPDAGDLWGYSFGARPPLGRDVTELRAGALRFARPFHDVRLLRLFAGFPRDVMVGEGMTRWPARAILAGRLPDAVVRRRVGMPFSPDYELRLVEQAPAAAARLPAFRAAGCDDWFDLDWLNEGLGRVAAGRLHDPDAVLRVQLTAHACEFLTWWRGG